MNNEEKNLPETESGEEIVEVKEEAKKQLPLGVLIGIIAGAIAVVTLVVLIIVLSGNNGGSKCDGHIDADDDYLCDKCGEHFDDGDEAVIPETDKINVTFTVKLDDGSALSGVKFVLTRGGKTVELVSGVDGTVVGSFEEGSYYIDFDHDTLPEYCWSDLPGIKIENGTSSIELTIINNKPDGTAGKPYPISDEAMDITLAPGEELYYSCRGTGIRYVTVNSSDLIINYNGETYTAVDGVITVGVSSVDVETPTIFSVKNLSDATVTAVLDTYAPLGSSENPIELVGNSAVAEVPSEKTVHYLYKVEKDGVLVLNSPTLGNSISITRNVNVVIDGETIIVPILTGTDNSSSAYICVSEGEDVKIGVSFIEPENSVYIPEDEADEEKLFSVEFEVEVYTGDTLDPVPVYKSDINLSLDSGRSVVFSSELGNTVRVSGASLWVDGNKVQSGVLTDSANFTVENESAESKAASVSVLAPLGSIENPIAFSGNSTTVSVLAGETVYYSFIAGQKGAFALTGYADGCSISVIGQLVELIETNGVFAVNLSYASASTSAVSPAYLNVSKGDVLTVAVTNNGSDDVNDLTLEYSVTAGKLAYTVIVLDDNGNSVSGASVDFAPKDADVVSMTTNADGRATYFADDNTTCTVVLVPTGFEYDKLGVPQAFDKNGVLSVEIKSVD